ncbi:Na+/H+ antiporter [Campylobacter avium LMG 24591]|uniref:Na(+)/H(+) antiporter NhaA n=1 Tax=Campylobacter avium LMG 24591 TaxID=522484 RepID=A0A222MZ39_9BACT|nr:Na+/H+ antiporter NhaA [Campylobacter avium]ASQ30998.1 Na+/H+ antiporter [Campylobacter avium LMG 24591]OYD78810.1 Na+/H+ antiporter [Campylobacter avium]
MNKILSIIKDESFGGILLIISTILALIVANNSHSAAYREFIYLPMGFHIDSFIFSKPLLLWINDGLISIFFFAIGLELKKEFCEGEFKNPRKIILPLFAAIGGIIVPALIFVAINFNNEYVLRGWAIPTATDTAFALAILLLLGKRIPSSLKIFLLSLAIFDDVGAILIIAIFYTSDLHYLALIGAGVIVFALLLLNLFGITRKSFYLICSVLLWLTVLQSGVHATLAGLITAFFIPLYKKNGAHFLDEILEGLRLWINFVILPIFAFANAGVDFSKLKFSDIFSGVSIGIFLGLFVGKQVGVFIFSYISVKLRLSKLPENSNFKQLYGICILTGIGFTMSLFIDGLAYKVSDTFNYADNFAILLASLCSGVFGYVFLRFFANK